VSGSAFVAVCALLFGATACAPRSRTLAARFVVQGTPTIDVGGIIAPLPNERSSGPRAAMPPPAPVRTAARHSNNLNTLEAASPALQKALLVLAARPDTQGYLDVAAAYRAAGVHDKAYDYLNEALHRDPTDAALHDTIARAWRDWGFPDRGLSPASKAVYYAPLSAEARNTLGTVLWALGQRAEARQAFEAAVALDARAWYAWNNLCHAAMAEGRTAAATAYCRRATALRRVDARGR
jgi:Flp pilus assembly protein TadD